MQRRELLRGIAGAVGLGSVALGSVGAAEAHPGPYRPFGSVTVETAREAVPDQSGEYVYLAADDGFAVVDVRVPSDPQVVAERRELLADRETGPLREIQDVKVEGDRLVAAGPANPKRGEVLQGVLVYDVNDPANPERVGFHETDFPIHNCDLADGRVYLTGNDGERNPVVVVDVRNDPREVGRWSMLDRDDRWDGIPTGLWNLHDVWVRDDRAYLAHWDAGVVVLDVSDPTDSSFVSRFAGRSLDDLESVPREDVRTHVIRLPGNVHYAMTDDAGDLLALNHEAWAVDGEGGPGGVELWDVSDETNPTRLSTIDAPATSKPRQQGTWTTSHNLDLVGDRLFTSWYQGGVKIHDVSDPANPSEMAWWREPEETAFWTAKRATSQFFVASTIGDYLEGVDAPSGLYTFPIEEDAQKDPPPLTTAERTTAERTTENATGEATTTETTTTHQTTTTAETTTEATDSAASSVPEFGISAGIAGLLGAGAWRKLRD
jgi:hypothetical protein